MAFTNNTIYDYLPRFYQIEANNLKALQPGFVVAQVQDLDSGANFVQEQYNLKGSSASTATDLIANGHIVTLEVDATSKKVQITDGAATGTLYIVYNEPIITIGASNDYARYATNTRGECLRLVQLIPGDEWMSDLDLLTENSNLAGRVIAVDGTNAKMTGEWYSDIQTSGTDAGKGYLADGTPAYHYIFLG